MGLEKYEGKKVILVTIRGNTYVGVAEDYTDAEDNIPEIASICIGDYEIYENEISSIKLAE